MDSDKSVGAPVNVWTVLKRISASLGLGGAAQMEASSARETQTAEPAWKGAQRTENASRRVALANAEFENLKEMHGHFYTLAAGSLERSKFAAETIQKASAAIAALYTGILAYVFSVTDSPLPLRGVLAPVFLGAAVVLSSVYLTYLVAPRDVDPAWNLPDGVALEQRAYKRLNAFIMETRAIVTWQFGLLGSALAALFVGLAYIVLPFVGVPQAFASPATEATVKAAAPWPAPDLVASGLPVELSAELYKQQIAETAALRAEARKPSAAHEPGSYVLFLALTGVLVTAVGWKLPLKPKK
jgi:hypothetical protein